MQALSVPGMLPVVSVDRLECLHPWDATRAPRAAGKNHTAGLDFTFLITQRLAHLILIVNAVSIYFLRL